MGDPSLKLATKTPCDGMNDVIIGDVSLCEIDLGVLTSLAPYRGENPALSNALKSAHGMALPATGRITGTDGARAIWFSQGQFLLAGPVPDSALTAHCAMTDQSDAWAIFRLEGARAVDVLARLTPIDLRASHFKRGQTARTELEHMAVSITRVGNKSFQIMGFRSMAATLVHDLTYAMESVAARALP